MAATIPESQIISVCYPTVELGTGTFHSHINIDSIKFSIFPSYKRKKPRLDGPGAGHKLPTVCRQF